MSAELLVRLKGTDLFNAMQIAQKLDCSVEDALSLSLQHLVEFQMEREDKKVDQSHLMGVALHNAFMKDEGEEFSLIDLLGDSWPQVDSPKAFGRHFRKRIESSEIGTLAYKTVDNKAIYRRTDRGEEPKLT